MRKSSLAVAFLLIAGSLLVSVTTLPEKARATTLYVGGIGPGNYTSIQDAIDNASAGSTVYVYSDVYWESVMINKTISLIGEDKKTTVIYSPTGQDTLSVAADWVNISGIRANGYLGNGIALDSVRNCRISGNAIRIHDGSNIRLSNSYDNTIIGNDVRSQSQYGIYIDGGKRNNITGNIVWNHSYGIYLLSSENTIAENDISWNRYTGLWVESSSHNDITSNNITSNGDDGIWMQFSSDNHIVENNILSNGDTGIEIESGSDNVLYHNLFMNNSRNADDESSNKWFIWSSGNYWDDYAGTDEDYDGIGDTWHNISGGENADCLPLMMSIAKLEGPVRAATLDTINLGLHDKTYGRSVTAKSWDVDASDGIQEDYAGDGPNHSYASSGFYTVTLTVVADRGYTTTDTMNVTIVDEILLATQDDAGDVMDEKDRKVGGHPDIDIINVTVARIDDFLLFEMTVAGTIQESPLWTSNNMYVYGLFFMDESDSVTDVDDADYALMCISSWSVLENETTGDVEYVEAFGFGTSTLTAFVPLSLIGNRTDFELNAMAAYYIGFNPYSETWDEAYIDLCSEPTSALDVPWIPFSIATLAAIGIVVAIAIYRTRKQKRELEVREPEDKRPK